MAYKVRPPIVPTVSDDLDASNVDFEPREDAGPGAGWAHKFKDAEYVEDGSNWDADF
jgi:hypothetical protein